MLKKIVINLTPPFIIKVFKKIKNIFSDRKKHKNIKNFQLHGWYAGFDSYEEIKKKCCGYSSGEIVNKCSQSLLKVKNGEAVYERDSVLFDKIQYSFPLLASLSAVASKSGNRLDLIDFGGSLGSSYFQNRKALSFLDYLRWSIVEQENFVTEGIKNFQDDVLKFYYTIEDCLKENKPNVIVLSSVLQYLENPYAFLEEIMKYNFENIIFDLTGFVEGGEDIPTLQIVPEIIYRADYACWFFNEEKFLRFFKDKYELVYDFDCSIGNDIEIYNYDKRAKYKGFYFAKKNAKIERIYENI